MNRITYLLKGHTRNNCVNCTKGLTEDAIPMFMIKRVFVKQYALMIVMWTLVNM
jgi:hypothetical protein